MANSRRQIAISKKRDGKWANVGRISVFCMMYLDGSRYASSWPADLCSVLIAATDSMPV